MTNYFYRFFLKNDVILQRPVRSGFLLVSDRATLGRYKFPKAWPLATAGTGILLDIARTFYLIDMQI